MQTDPTAPLPTDPTVDTLAGDQKTTLSSAEWVQKQLLKFGINTIVFYNPTVAGMDYVEVEDFNRDKVETGEHIFLNFANNTYANSDLLLKNLENDNLNAYNKIARCMLDFQMTTTPYDLPEVQHLTNEAMTNLLES